MTIEKLAVEKLTIDHIGSQGDGIAKSSNGPIFVPFALPGEQVAVELDGSKSRIVEHVDSSSDRAQPACSHFKDCGGCTSQHMSADLYQSWKLEILNSALAKAGIDFKATELLACAPGERRRVVFSATISDQGFSFGYHQSRSKQVIDIVECPVATPEIINELIAIKDIGKTVASPKHEAQLTILVCENGLDISISGVQKISEDVRKILIKKAVAFKALTRLSLGDDVILKKQAPQLTLGQTPVLPPPVSFAQASHRAEKQMVSLVSKHLSKSKKIADLFSGFGTFSLPLAQKSAVHAVEFEGPSLMALDQAVRIQQGLKPVTIERRDLFRRPLMRDELKKYDGVVFDPPRAGAKEQVKQLTRSNVKKIVAVSCNPTSLARDLADLLGAGYKIKSLVAIDQFLWSPHVEAVCLLEK